MSLGELWIDNPATVNSRNNQIPANIRENFFEFIEKGYTIFRNVVPDSVIDEIVADMQAYNKRPENYILKNKGRYIDPTGHPGLDRADRVVDLYAVSAAARESIAAKQVADFLTFIFDDEPIAMQSISFEYGSQQAIHQDTAYVISEKPLSLAASWLALEDIDAGTGELVYYPGSHRFEHFLFGGERKGWIASEDGQEQHQAFLKGLHDKAAEKGIQADRFLARKGDVLIWHADLAHGGSRITVPNRTRRSLVTHYVPRSVKAVYRKHVTDLYYEYQHENGVFFTSRHYDLNPLGKGGQAELIYDGGVSKKRKHEAGMARRQARGLA